MAAQRRSTQNRWCLSAVARNGSLAMAQLHDGLNCPDNQRFHTFGSESYKAEHLFRLSPARRHYHHPNFFVSWNMKSFCHFTHRLPLSFIHFYLSKIGLLGSCFKRINFHITD